MLGSRRPTNQIRYNFFLFRIALLYHYRSPKIKSSYNQIFIKHGYKIRASNSFDLILRYFNNFTTLVQVLASGMY